MVVRFNFRDVFGEELTRFKKQFGAHAVKDETFSRHLSEDKSSHFTHVHSRDHLLESAPKETTKKKKIQKRTKEINQGSLTAGDLG